MRKALHPGMERASVIETLKIESIVVNFEGTSVIDYDRGYTYFEPTLFTLRGFQRCRAEYFFNSDGRLGSWQVRAVSDP